MRQTKKLLGRLALLLLPIVAYYALFIAFEPNNYFGLKARADGTDIMATLRRYEGAPADNILLGDSRLAKLDMDAARQQTGLEWENLAFGGAALKEQLDVLDWAMAQNPRLKRVIFMLSFYTLNQGYNQDRMVIKALDNPLMYMTNLGYNINMLTNLYDHLSPARAVGDKGQSPTAGAMATFTDPATGQVVPMRQSMATHLHDVYARSESWRLNTAQLQRLLAAIDACGERGIAVTVVLPPAAPAVRQYITQPLGIEAAMAPVRDVLAASPAQLVDFESEAGGAAFGEALFFDGFHLDEQGLAPFAQALFAAVEQGGGHGA